MVDRDPQAGEELESLIRADKGGEEPLFGIGDLSKHFGISTRAIRFYESRGLINPVRVNGTRVYTRRDRARLTLILRAKSIGTSLAEISHYLDLYGNKGEGRLKQLEYVAERTRKTITDLETRRSDIDKTLMELNHILGETERAITARRNSR